MKVFISSTYIDLVEYRKAAHDALERIGQEAGHLEILGERTDEAISAALGQLEKSDLVVGIYAYRYGTIPDGNDTSVIEQEFTHTKDKGLPILCFVLDENEPWPPKMMEKDPARVKKLDDFKARVLKEKALEFFTSPADLGMKVATSVHNYLETHKPTSVLASSLHIGGNVNGNIILGNQNAISEFPTLFPVAPKPTGSTLPRQPYFFGREEELKTIASALAPESRTWGALIDGPGGIGKTALAIRAAHLASENLFEQKILITSKVRELTPIGEKPLADFTRPDYLAMLNELAQELGEDSIQRLAPEERANALRLALAGRKILIIFDNLETLGEDERVRLFQFLSRLPPGNKAIVTSRQRTDVDARILRLDRFKLNEALDLIKELAKTNKRLKRETKDERRKLYEVTGGNPLLIKWVCGQLGREGSSMQTLAEAREFIESAPQGNDPLEYIFGDLVKNLTSNEILVLSAIIHFFEPTNSNTIAKITRFPIKVAQATIEDLIDRAILVGDSQAKLCHLPTLTARFLRRTRSDLSIHSASKIRDLAYKLIVNTDESQTQWIKILEAEWPLISAAIPLFVNGRYDNLQTVCRYLDSFLEFSGRWNEWLNLSIQAEAKAVKNYDHENAGWRAYNAAWVYYLLQQPENVLIYASRAETHWKKSQSGYLEQAVVLRLKGMAYQLKQNYELAINAFYEALDFQIRIRPGTKEVASSLNDLAEAERLVGNYAGAERDLLSALRIAEELTDREGAAIYLCNLAGLALDREAWQDAEKYAKEALPKTEEIGRQELIAMDCLRLTKALIPQNRAIEGMVYIRRSIEIFNNLRSKELDEAKKLLRKIEQHQDQT